MPAALWFWSLAYCWTKILSTLKSEQQIKHVTKQIIIIIIIIIIIVEFRLDFVYCLNKTQNYRKDLSEIGCLCRPLENGEKNFQC
jgi:hypothetical protein